MATSKEEGCSKKKNEVLYYKSFDLHISYNAPQLVLLVDKVCSVYFLLVATSSFCFIYIFFHQTVTHCKCLSWYTGLTTCRPRSRRPTKLSSALPWTPVTQTPTIPPQPARGTAPETTPPYWSLSPRARSSGSPCQMWVCRHLPLTRTARRVTPGPPRLTSTRCSWSRSSLGMVSEEEHTV